ncbi:MAG: glycerophosphodiester phosphodiesterase family protein [Clostridia bacterium]|nr:glycerophosphodiester phosphodiesterase family protein [Clostridia bacterium]
MGTLTTVLLVLLAIFLVIVLLWLWAIAPRLTNRPSFEELEKWDYAHRGLHDDKIPENSLPAFENAVKHGYGMEFDLQLTKDKQVVIHHDNNLKRICGVDKKISDLTLEELNQIHLYDTDCTCPLFSDVLKTVDGKTPLIIEFKGYNNVEELCEAGWEVLKDYKGLYCVESFHPGIVHWFRKNQPQVIRGQLMVRYTSKDPETPTPIHAFMARNLLTNFYARPDFEAYDYHTRNNLSLKLCRKVFGIQEVSWTVRDRDTHEELKSDGCISIFEKFMA